MPERQKNIPLDSVANKGPQQPLNEEGIPKPMENPMADFADRLGHEQEKQHLRELMHLAIKQLGAATYINRVEAFANQLKTAHRDYDQYELYHLLAGGSTDEVKFTYYDLPPPDSIADFIKNLSGQNADQQPR